MSYCRFSCDNWQSDVYVYEAVGGGYQVHVAAERLDRHVAALDGRTPERFMKTYRVQMAELDECERVPIGLPYDGQSFSLDDAEDCLSMLNHLRDTGYNVPQVAIDAIAEECEE